MPGGDPILAGAVSTELKPALSIKGKGGGKDKFPFRSKSAGSRHKASWLSRKLKKAFHGSSNEGGGGGGDGGGGDGGGVPYSSSHSGSSPGKRSKNKFSLPQVQITVDCSGSGDSSEEEAALRGADESGIAKLKKQKPGKT